MFWSEPELEPAPDWTNGIVTSDYKIRRRLSLYTELPGAFDCALAFLVYILYRQLMKWTTQTTEFVTGNRSISMNKWADTTS